MVNKKIVELMMFGLVLGLAAPAGGAQTKPKPSGPIECEIAAKEHSNSSKPKGTAKTCEKNIREGVEPELLKVLDNLEKLGQTVKDLQAKLILDRLEIVVADRTIKKGKLYYQREKEKIRVRISFETTREGKRTRREREDFVFVDGWLTHRQ